MGYLEFHMKKRGPALAVGIKVIKNSQDDEDSQNGIQGDEEEIIDFGPPESSPVEALEEKNDQMDNQKQGKNRCIRVERRDPFLRIHWDDVSIKPKHIGIKEGNEYSEDIAQYKKADQTCPLSLDHDKALCSSHFCRKKAEISILNLSLEKFKAFSLVLTLLNSKLLNLSRTSRRLSTISSWKNNPVFSGTTVSVAPPRP
jgi:hypothetical protein